jgi:lipoprotein NlpI
VRAAQKDFDNALSDYNRAIQLDPTYLPAFYQRGTLKGMAGDFDAAVDDFNQVIKLDPKYAAAYYNIGHVDYFRGDFDGAVDQINKALAIQPDFFLGYFIRGLVRHAQGHLTEAQADFQKSASLNFTYATFWIWISQTEDGHRGIARQNLADALAKPEIFKAGDWASQIANFLLEKISQDDLIAAAGQGDPADGKNRLCEAWFYAGMVKHFAGDNKGALECYAKAVATDAKGSEEFAEASRRLTK